MMLRGISSVLVIKTPATGSSDVNTAQRYL